MNSFKMDTIELTESIHAAPSLITIAGPTGSGKSCIVIDILKNADKLFAQPVESVVYFYSEMQELFKSAPENTKFHFGMPEEGGLLEYISNVLTEVMDSSCLTT